MDLGSYREDWTLQHTDIPVSKGADVQEAGNQSEDKPLSIEVLRANLCYSLFCLGWNFYEFNFNLNQLY